MKKSRRMMWERHVAGIMEKRNAYRLLEGNRPLGRIRHRWVDSIRMDVGCGVDWLRKGTRRELLLMQ
jgi:hypothetical protein